MDCFVARAPRNDGVSFVRIQFQTADACPHSRGAMRPGLAMDHPQGMPGARCTRGLVCKFVRRRRTRAYRFSGGIRHSLRNGFTAYAGLSSATNSSCHRRQRIDGMPKPGWADTPPRTWRQQRASGPHGFAVRKMRRSSRTPRTTHEFDLALRLPLRADALASTTSHPAFRDDSRSALLSGRDSVEVAIDLDGREAKYFREKGLDDPNQVEMTAEISVCARRIFSAPSARAKPNAG